MIIYVSKITSYILNFWYIKSTYDRFIKEIKTNTKAKVLDFVEGKLLKTNG